MGRGDGSSVDAAIRRKSSASGTISKGRKKKSDLSRKKLFKEFRDYLKPLDKAYAKDLEKAEERERKEDWLSMEPRIIGFPNSWKLPGDLPGGFVRINREPEVMRVEARDDRMKLLKKKEREEVQEYLDVLNEKLAKRQVEYEKEEDEYWEKKEEKALKKMKKREARKEQEKRWAEEEEMRYQETRRQEAEAKAKHRDAIGARVDESVALDGIGGVIKNIRRGSDATVDSINEALSGRNNLTWEAERHYDYIEASLSRTWGDKYQVEVEAIEDLEELLTRTRNPLYRLRIKQHLEVLGKRAEDYKNRSKGR